MAKSSEDRAKLERAEAKAERKIAALRAKMERKMARLREEYEEAVADVRSKLESKREKAAKRAARHGDAADAGRSASPESSRPRDTKLPGDVPQGVVRRVAQAVLSPGPDTTRRTR